MAKEFVCPACRLPLGQVRMAHGIFWACESCGGRALSVELLRRTFTDETINPFWRRVLGNPGPGDRACPCCGRPMLQVALADAADSPAIDVCRLCHFVWFDANEIAALTPRPPPAAKRPPMSKEEREAIAMLEVRRLADRRRSDSDPPSPAEWWRQLAAFFGGSGKSGKPA